MRTLTVALTRALVVAVLLLIVSAPLAAADEPTIPLNKDQRISDNINAHLIQVVVKGAPISNEYWVEGDPGNYIWPTLYYYYENKGSAAETGHLTVRFTDDKGDEYKISDAGTLDRIDPGQRTGERTLNVGIPKDRKVVRMTVVKGFDEYPYELTYATATATQTTTPTGTTTQPAGTSTPTRFCLGSWALPLFIGGVVILGTGLRFSRYGRK
ncbi:hypothetical protein [Methanocella sp. MCL-LM]|uniref:hypothetical protein n=1 Tax=Methanocella sp. MCL-LM TaxID=3412035 RepID=UPI003C7312C9